MKLVAALPLALSVFTTLATAESPYRASEELDAREFRNFRGGFPGAHHKFGGARDLDERDLAMGPVLGSVAAGLYGREAQDELEAHLISRDLTLGDAMLAARDPRYRSAAAKALGRISRPTSTVALKIPKVVSNTLLRLLRHAPIRRGFTTGPMLDSVAAGLFGREVQDELAAHLLSRGLTLDDVEAAGDAQERGLYEEPLDARSGDLYASDMFGRNVEDLHADLLGLF